MPRLGKSYIRRPLLLQRHGHHRRRYERVLRKFRGTWLAHVAITTVPPSPPFSLPVCEEKRKAGCITDRARRQCDPMSDTCLAELYGVERRKDKFYLKRSQLRLRCTQGRVRGPIPPPHPSFCSLCLLALTHKAKPGRWQKLTLICFSLVRSFRRCGEAGYLRCQESPGPRPGSEVFLMRGCITRAGWRGHTVVHELLWGSGSLLSA